MPIDRKLRAILRYLLITAAGLLLVLVILTAAVYYVAVSDQERVPELIKQTSRRSFGGEAAFSHYRFRYLDHFPFLSLSLEDVAIRDPCFEEHGRELLRARELTVVFRPWKLLRRQFEVRSVVLDSARIQLYRSPGGYFNAGFLAGDSLNFLAERPDSSGLLSIDKIQARNVAFDFMDSLRAKRFHFDLQRSIITVTPTAAGRKLRLSGQWFIHELAFRLENGPYLRGQKAGVNLNIMLNGQGAQLLPSTVALEADTLYLEGRLTVADTNYLHLAISSRGIRLEEARPLLADNLQKALKPYSIGQPVPLAILIDGPVLPGQPQPMEVTFQTEGASLATPSLRFSHLALQARYTNNCDSSGPITPHSDCLDIELISARLFDTVSIAASYHAEDMKRPVVKVEGRLETPLANINGFLPGGQLRFRGGKGELAFSFTGPPGALSEPGQDMSLRGEARLRNATLDYMPRGIKLEDINAGFQFDERSLFLENLQLILDGHPYRVKGKFDGLISSLFGKSGRSWASLEVKAPMLNLEPLFSKPESAEKPAAPSRSRQGVEAQAGNALERITSQLELNLRVEAEELRYHKLRARDVAFTGLLLPSCPEEGPGRCLSIDSLSARIFGGIPIKASLRLSRWEDPLVDMSLSLATPAEHFNRMLPPGKLRLKGGSLELQLAYRGRLDDYSGWKAAALDAGFQGRAALKGVAADYFPKGLEFRKLDGAFHFDAHDLVVDSLAFLLNDNEAKATGRVEGLAAFAFEPGRKLRAVLDISSPELDLNRFPYARRRDKADGQPPPSPGPITQVFEAALAKIEGSLAVKAGQLRFRNLSLADVRFQGQLLPACNGQPQENGCIIIEKLAAKIFGTAPFQSTLAITNLEDPFFIADVQVEMPLEELNRMFAPGQFQFHQGTVELGFHYEGRPKGRSGLKNALLEAQLKGEGAIRGGAFDYKPRGYRFSRVDAHFGFDETDLSIKNIRLLLNGNTLWGMATFKGFLPFLLLPERELNTSLEVHAGQFDLGNFKAPQKFLQPSVGQPQDSTVVTRLVNAGLQNLRAQVRVDIDSLKYRNFQAHSVKGELTMTPNLLRFEDAEMALCDGLFQLNGQVAGLAENRPDINIQATFRKTDIAKVFESFDDFGQRELTSENIRGLLDANILFRACANANYDLLPASMEGRFLLRVENGALINLPALDSLQGFLFRGRGLSHIQFATLENSFDLEGRNLLVDHFFVASTALSFGVEGRYVLGEAPGTNLLFDLPLRNLFWRGMDVEGLEELQHKKRGPSILLRATEGEHGGLDFRWVLSRGK